MPHNEFVIVAIVNITKNIVVFHGAIASKKPYEIMLCIRSNLSTTNDLNVIASRAAFVCSRYTLRLKDTLVRDTVIVKD